MKALLHPTVDMKPEIHLELGMVQLTFTVWSLSLTNRIMSYHHGH